MKAVLLSINPKWCELIASGKKTIEVRKTKPKLETPFKCYIYKTKVGEVIGEFICDYIIFYAPGYAGNHGDSCLTYDEEIGYFGDDGSGYGWHISDLVIYDEPKELSDFMRFCDLAAYCEFCKHAIFDGIGFSGCGNVVNRPPQSWCYVEEVT